MKKRKMKRMKIEDRILRVKKQRRIDERKEKEEEEG